MKSIIIIGGGSIGRRHTRNLLSLGAKKITMIEPDIKRHSALSSELPGVTLVSGLEKAIVSNESAVFVCSPSVFHLEQALYCAERGADLFIEKPVAHTVERLEELRELVKKNNLVSMVGSNWKFYPLFQTMKEMLSKGAIGRVLSARCQFGQYLPDWHPYEDYRQGYSANKKLGGGILLDSHEFDYLIWLMGESVKKIVCFADKVSNLEIDVEDTAEVILQFVSGAIGEIHLDYTQRFYQRNFEFFGETGTLIWDTNLKKVFLKSKENGEQEFSLPKDYDINQMYVEEVKHFIQAIETRNSTITPVAAGAKVVELISAARRSSETNQVIFL